MRSPVRARVRPFFFLFFSFLSFLSFFPFFFSLSFSPMDFIRSHLFRLPLLPCQPQRSGAANPPERLTSALNQKKFTTAKYPLPLSSFPHFPPSPPASFLLPVRARVLKSSLQSAPGLGLPLLRKGSLPFFERENQATKGLVLQRINPSEMSFGDSHFVRRRRKSHSLPIIIPLF